jgi:shikimate kinase
VTETAHVALVGLMGSGKTTVGRRAAKLLGRPFVDADEAFIPRFGRTVAETFAAVGEPGFRDQEATLLVEVLAVTTPLVLATGGGVVTREANRTRLSAPDVFVVYLHADPAFLASRAQAKADRFLLAGDEPVAVLSRLYAERDGWYRQVADEILEVGSFHEWGSQPKRAMAERVAQLVRELPGSGGGSPRGATP